MKLSKLIKELQKIHKEVGEQEVMLSGDDEGNYFGTITEDSFSPEYIKGTMVLFPGETTDEIGG